MSVLLHWQGIKPYRGFEPTISRLHVTNQPRDESGHSRKGNAHSELEINPLVNTNAPVQLVRVSHFDRNSVLCQQQDHNSLVARNAATTAKMRRSNYRELHKSFLSIKWREDEMRVSNVKMIFFVLVRFVEFRQSPRRLFQFLEYFRVFAAIYQLVFGAVFFMIPTNRYYMCLRKACSIFYTFWSSYSFNTCKNGNEKWQSEARLLSCRRVLEAKASVFRLRASTQSKVETRTHVDTFCRLSRRCRVTSDLIHLHHPSVFGRLKCWGFRNG